MTHRTDDLDLLPWFPNQECKRGNCKHDFLNHYTLLDGLVACSICQRVCWDMGVSYASV